MIFKEKTNATMSSNTKLNESSRLTELTDLTCSTQTTNSTYLSDSSAIVKDKIVINSVKFSTWNLIDIALENPHRYDIYERDDLGNSAIHFTVYKNRPYWIKRLLVNRFPVDDVNYANETPMHLAASLNHIAVMKILVKYKANLNGLDVLGQSPVFKAVVGGHLTSVKFLGKEGAKLSLVDNFGNTLLHLAAKVDFVEILQYLIDRKLNVNQFDQYGRTALDCALTRDSFPAALTLIKNNAVIRGDYLTLAITKEHRDLVEALLPRTDVNLKDETGKTPFMVAARVGHVDIGKLLLAHDAQLNAKDKDGLSALHIAASHGREPFIRFLLSEGVNHKAVTYKGLSAMRLAALNDHVTTFYLLLAHGIQSTGKAAVTETVQELIAERRLSRFQKFRKFFKHFLKNMKRLAKRRRNQEVEVIKETTKSEIVNLDESCSVADSSSLTESSFDPVEFSSPLVVQNELFQSCQLNVPKGQFLIPVY